MQDWRDWWERRLGFIYSGIYSSLPPSLCLSLSPIVQTNRLQNQATRYKNQVKELEEREDQLMKEKRHQAKEVSSEIHKIKSIFLSS